MLSMRKRLVHLILLICATLPSFAWAQPASSVTAPRTKVRALLEKKDAVIVREYSAPISLDTRNNTGVDIAAFAFQAEGDATSKLKGLRLKIRYDNKGLRERVAYLDMEEANAFSKALGSLSNLSMKWLEAKRKGNAESEFVTQDGFAVGFYVDANGDHQGYFAIEGERVMFNMSPTLITAVKGHIDKLITDLQKV
jgi:hypothetical protein